MSEPKKKFILRERGGGKQRFLPEKLTWCEKYANSNKKTVCPNFSYSSVFHHYHHPPAPLCHSTSLRSLPCEPPDRKLINECKRGNVVDKFNKIVHAQLVSPTVNRAHGNAVVLVSWYPQILTINRKKGILFFYPPKKILNF